MSSVLPERLARRRPAARTGAAGAQRLAACAPRSRRRGSSGAPPSARSVSAVQVLQQLALPGVPDLRAGAADVGDGQQVERGQAALVCRPARRRRAITSGSDRSCFCATRDIVRCCSTRNSTSSRVLARRCRGRGRSARASRAPSSEWSPPRPLAMSWNSAATYSTQGRSKSAHQLRCRTGTRARARA